MKWRVYGYGLAGAARPVAVELVKATVRFSMGKSFLERTDVRPKNGDATLMEQPGRRQYV